MSKALFVIDMQEATVGENHAPMFHYDENIVSSVNGIIESTDADCIVYIRNLMKNNFLNKLAPVKCFDGTEASKLVEGLTVIGDNIYSKYEGNAFSNKDLCSLLEKQGMNNRGRSFCHGLCVDSGTKGSPRGRKNVPNERGGKTCYLQLMKR